MSKMRIGDLAERTGVSRRSVRYYEQHGLIEAGRTNGDWREFDESTVQRVRNIAVLLRKGLTIEGVKRLEPCLGQADFFECDDPTDAIETYESRLAVLDGRLETLSAQRHQLAALVHDMRGQHE